METGWAHKTLDGGLSCQYEHQFVITKDGPVILSSQGERRNLLKIEERMELKDVSGFALCSLKRRTKTRLHKPWTKLIYYFVSTRKVVFNRST